MKTIFVKRLITAGKMQVARMVRMNISGTWQLSNFTAHLANPVLAAASLLLALLPAKRAAVLLPRKLQQLRAKNNLRNNFSALFLKISAYLLSGYFL